MKRFIPVLCLLVCTGTIGAVLWYSGSLPSRHAASAHPAERLDQALRRAGRSHPASELRLPDPLRSRVASQQSSDLASRRIHRIPAEIVTTQRAVRLASNYDDSVAPDEDLLFISPGQPFDPSYVVQPRPTTTQPAPVETPDNPPATVSETKKSPVVMNPQLPLSNQPIPAVKPSPQNEPNRVSPIDEPSLDPSRLQLDPPDNGPSNGPPTSVPEGFGGEGVEALLAPDAGHSAEPKRPQPVVTPPQPTNEVEKPLAAPSPGTAWSKDTPPGNDEDLLTGLPEPNQAPVPTNPSVGLPTPNQPQTSSDTLPQTPQILATPQNSTGQSVSPLMNPHRTAPKPSSSETNAIDPHAELYGKSMYPSAKECRTCHEQIYDEWAVSSHAYASISPMFQKFEQTIHGLTQGTISYFCYRCHAPVATNLTHPREANIWDSIPSATEGVTCIACHRVSEEYGKVNGERRIETGDIYEPVYGTGYGQGLAEVLANKSQYKVKSPGDKGPGQNIHQKVIHFDQISSSHFCVSCHQVAVVPGIALEVVWAQYRASPACKQGIQCQDCHMGREPGVAAGYDSGPVAVVNNILVSPERKHSNHMFYGPGYSIAHPGIFPFNPKADNWTVREWLEFDFHAGWGTEQFEKLVEDEKIRVTFPESWDNSDDRMDAREIVDANIEKLHQKRHMRHRLMENGSNVEGPFFSKTPVAGKPLRFHYKVTNTNPGHNMPSGSLGAQPQVWLNVALTGPQGQHLWESGYVDSLGDVADVHSIDVAAGKIKRDLQLFNLQTKFLITNVKGTDREAYLPVNWDFDQLPFIRQSGFPITVMNHPPFIRMEGHSLPPLGSRAAKYRVPAKLMQQPGTYRLSIRMRSRAEPIYFMRFCNATAEMERNMNYWMLDYHEEAFEFFVQ